MSLPGDQSRLEGSAIPGASPRSVGGQARRFRVSGWGLIFVACLLLSLVVRLRGLDVFLTADELKWMCRSINFRSALLEGDLARTFQVGHPGVTTMWAGTLGVPFNLRSNWSDECSDTRITRLVATLGPERMGELVQMTFLARRPVAIFTWLCTVAMALLACRLFGLTAGLLVAILVGFDPLFLALSRVLHIDALAGSLMIVSLLALLVGLVGLNDPSLRRARVPGVNRYLVGSGLVAGLAFLSKSPALFLGPFAVVVILAVTWSARRRGDPPWLFLAPALAWCAAAGLAVLLLWPALWVNPLGTVLAVFDKAAVYAAEGHDEFEYFMGRVSNDPGPAYYPVAWAFRTTPLVWLGLLALVWQAARWRWASVVGGKSSEARDRSSEGEGQSIVGGYWTLLAVIGFGLLFALFMTVGAKKFDRYIVPTFLALDIAAAVGLARIFDRWRSQQRREFHLSRVDLAGVGLVAVAAVALVLPYGPYQLSYYNPLLGGGSAAVRLLQVGWGEGLEQAAAYLNAQPDSRSLHAATRDLADFGPLFDGHTDELEGYDSAQVDYLVFYINQIQRQLYPAVLERYVGAEKPAHVVRMFGIEYALVYANADSRPVAAYLVEHADPLQDAVVLDRPSRLQRDYVGPLPVSIVSSEWDATRVASALAGAARGKQRLWYATYARGRDDSDRVLQHWLDTRTWLSGSQKFPTIRLAAHDLLEPPVGALPEPDRPADVVIGDRLKLRGFGLDPVPAQFGRGLSVALDWEALQPPGEDLAVSLRLVDAAGHVWGEGSKAIGSLERLTSDWTAGETWLDRAAVYVVPGTPAGRYELVLSVTQDAGKERLTGSEPGAPLDTEWRLGTVEVAPSPKTPSLVQMGIKSETPSASLSLPGKDGDAVPVELLAAQVPSEVFVGESLPVTLFWENTAPLGGDYRLRLSLLSDRSSPAEIVASTWWPTGDYRTSRWRPGERLRSRLDLGIPANAPAGPARLRVEFVDAAGVRVGEAVDAAGVDVVGENPVVTLPADLSGRLDVQLGDQITLAGYNLEPAGDRPALAQGSAPVLVPGGTLSLTLYWQASGAPDRDYKVFVHLVDPSGQIRSQVDRVPAAGRYPTSRWVEGDVVADRYDLSLPAGSPSGLYQLFVGVYDPDTLQRLPAVDADGGRLLEDRVALGDVDVRK